MSQPSTGDDSLPNLIPDDTDMIVEVTHDGSIVVGSSFDFGDAPETVGVGSGFTGSSLADVVEDEEEGVEAPLEFFSFLDTLIYGCVGCEPCSVSSLTIKPREGILKKGGAYGATRPIDRSVSFSSLEIKEFSMSLGDHPCSGTGPPVMLDWESKPTLERVVSLDEYERHRSPRRSRSKLRLSYRDRKGILEGQQRFTAEEVNRAWAEALRIRQQRQETLKRGVLLNTWDDVCESWQRKCHRVAEAVGMA